MKYKNITYAVVFYIIALVITLTGVPFKYFIASPSSYNLPMAILIGVVLALGIIFSLKSNKKKESPWAGNLLGVIGILSFLFTFFVVYLSSSL